MAASDSQLTLKMCQLTCRCFLLPSMADKCSVGCSQLAARSPVGYLCDKPAEMVKLLITCTVCTVC